MEIINAGPAPLSPAAATPTMAKIPEPIIAPTPKSIKSQAPSVFSNPPFCAFKIASSRFLRLTKFFVTSVSVISILSSFNGKLKMESKKLF